MGFFSANMSWYNRNASSIQATVVWLLGDQVICLTLRGGGVWEMIVHDFCFGGRVNNAE
jgi:hypothetical protein